MIYHWDDINGEFYKVGWSQDFCGYHLMNGNSAQCRECTKWIEWDTHLCTGYCKQFEERHPRYANGFAPAAFRGCFVGVFQEHRIPIREWRG